LKVLVFLDGILLDY